LVCLFSLNEIILLDKFFLCWRSQLKENHIFQNCATWQKKSYRYFTSFSADFMDSDKTKIFNLITFLD
jgi:hypothetical protein